MLQHSSAPRVIEDLRVAFFLQGKTQGQIAIETGMSQSAVSRRLKGDVDPTFQELNALAAAAGYEIKVELVPTSDGTHRAERTS